MMGHLIFVESNTSGTGRLFLETARAMGLTPLMVVRDPDRYAFLKQDRIDIQLADTANMESLRAAFQALSSSHGIHGVTSSSEYFIPAAARLAAEHGLPGPNPDAVTLCRDKSYQRHRLKMLRIDDVVSIPVRTIEEAKQAAAMIGLPVVVKPAKASGSVGVLLCRQIEDVEAHVGRFIADQPAMLVEPVLAGPEFSVELMNGEIVGITGKHVSAPPFFVETGHDFPASLPAAMKSAIEEFCLKIVRALDLQWGPLHIELKHDGIRPHLIEINPRLAGGYIPLLIRTAIGRDLIAETVALAAALPSAKLPSLRRAAALRFIIPPHDGTIHAIQSLPETRVAGIEDCRLYRGLPYRFIEQHDFNDRIGHVIASGETLAAAQDKAQAAVNGIVFTYRSDHSPLKEEYIPSSPTQLTSVALS